MAKASSAIHACQQWKTLRLPEIPTPKFQKTLAGSSGPDKAHASLSSRSANARSGSSGQEESVYAVGERLDIQLLLSVGVPQEQIAELTGVSVHSDGL